MGRACTCGCGKPNVSASTEQRHIRGKAAPHIRANIAARRRLLAPSHSKRPADDTCSGPGFAPKSKRTRIDPPPAMQGSSSTSSGAATTPSQLDDFEASGPADFDLPTNGSYEPSGSGSEVNGRRARVEEVEDQDEWTRTPLSSRMNDHRARVEDIEDDDDDFVEFENPEESDGDEFLEDYGDEDEELEGLSVEEIINLDFERDLANFGEYQFRYQ